MQYNRKVSFDSSSSDLDYVDAFITPTTLAILEQQALTFQVEYGN